MIRLPKRKLASLSRRLLSDEQGATVMEFGLMVTVFMTLMLGLFDLGQLAYTQSVLNGAVQEAGRASSLEINDTTGADARVLELTQIAAPDATIETKRVSYFDFADVERAESWNDEDGDGICNDGEGYTDENGNGQWDEDVGAEGNGGAGDVVIYTVTATYSPLFPNPFYPGGKDSRSVTSSTVKKNQPFAEQAGLGSDAGVCD